MRPILSAAVALLLGIPTLAHADPRDAELQNLSQGFSDACAKGDGYVLTIARDGDTLKDSTNGSAPYLIEAEARDVLFTPGQPRLRRIIERDASGRIVALRSRRDGHDFVLKRI